MLLSDEEIKALILEAKAVPRGLMPLGRCSERHQHRRKDYTVECPSGHKFMIALRQSMLNSLDFSVILGYHLPHLFRVFRLCRYNGKSHHHTNTLEKESFYGFHIHMATARYQTAGFKEDHFAAAPSRYFDLESAIECMLVDCGFKSSPESGPLFTGIVE
jgi:hypothetical protein